MMREPLEYLFMNSLMGGGGNLLAVAYLAGAILLLVFKPEKITQLFIFRVSYILFCLALFLPSTALVAGQMFDRTGGGMPLAQNSALPLGFLFDLGLIIRLAAMAGPALMAASIFCLLTAIMPRRTH